MARASALPQYKADFYALNRGFIPVKFCGFAFRKNGQV